VNNYQIALTLLKGIGPKKAKLLLSKLDSIESIFNDSYSKISGLTGMGINLLKQMDRKDALAKSISYQDYFTKNGIQTQVFVKS